MQSTEPEQAAAAVRGAESTAPATPLRMRALVAERYGTPDVLELREVDVPAIADHQVLVRVHAASVNPVEFYRVHGPYFARVADGLRRPKRPALGADLAGRVVAVGADVTELAPGDEVFGTSLAAWAEYAVAREARLVRKPPNVSFEEAAAVPVAAVTALQAVRDQGRVQPGQKVLVNGAAGGVGTFTVQLAKVFGAEVTAVCSTQNVEQARSLGADHVVSYEQEDFTRSGRRHDVAIDIAGSRSLSELRRVLTPEATLVVVGARMKASGLGPLPHIVGTRIAAIGRSQTVRFFVAKISKEDLVVLQGLLADGRIRSVIDRRFPLESAADALRYLGGNHARGKLVLTV